MLRTGLPSSKPDDITGLTYKTLWAAGFWGKETDLSVYYTENKTTPSWAVRTPWGGLWYYSKSQRPNWEVTKCLTASCLVHKHRLRCVRFGHCFRKTRPVKPTLERGIFKGYASICHGHFTQKRNAQQTVNFLHL